MYTSVFTLTHLETPYSSAGSSLPDLAEVVAGLPRAGLPPTTEHTWAGYRLPQETGLHVAVGSMTPAASSISLSVSRLAAEKATRQIRGRGGACQKIAARTDTVSWATALMACAKPSSAVCPVGRSKQKQQQQQKELFDCRRSRLQHGCPQGGHHHLRVCVRRS